MIASTRSRHVPDDAMLISCGVALATLVPVALYQTGVIEGLPDPPSDIFASERITSSKIAHPLGVPDSLLGLASFGTTLGLILASRRSETARFLLGGKLALDAGAASFNAVRQVVLFQSLCSWCTGTALAAGLTSYMGRDLIAASWKTVRRGVEAEIDG